MAKELAELFVDKKVAVHEGGHYVAGKKFIYDEFFSKMYENKELLNE